MMTRRPRFTVHTDDREWSVDSAPLLSFRLQNHDARGKTMSGLHFHREVWSIGGAPSMVCLHGGGGCASCRVAVDPLNVSERRAGRSQFVS